MFDLKIGDRVRLTDEAFNSLSGSTEDSAKIIEIRMSNRFVNLKVYKLNGKLCTGMFDYTISGNWIELSEPTIHIGAINV